MPYSASATAASATAVSAAVILDAPSALRAARGLVEDPGHWLPAPARRAGDGWLTSVRAGRMAREVLATVGAPFVDGTTVRRRLSWTPLAGDGVQQATLLPGFEGVAELGGEDPAVLVIKGDYLPPAGLAGRTLDKLMLHHVARHTIATLADEVAAAFRQRPDDRPERASRSASMLELKGPPPHAEV